MENQQISSINVLGEGFVVDGIRVTIPTHCVISGTIHQHVECLGKLVLNNIAVIQGNIKAADLVLKGSYEGTIWVKGTVTLSSTARFSGTISACKLIVEEGALCNMDMQIDSDASKRHEKAQLTGEILPSGTQEADDEESTSNDPSDNDEKSTASDKKRSRKRKKEASDEVTDEIEMDRSDAPGKVADHFW